jgi:hypothetical protein
MTRLDTKRRLFTFVLFTVESVNGSRLVGGFYHQRFAVELKPRFYSRDAGNVKAWGYLTVAE